MATPLAYRATAGASATLGAQASVSLAGASTGDMMVLYCHTTGGAVATPSGWTSIRTGAVGSAFYGMFYRQKAGGDTTVAVGGGGVAPTEALAVFIEAASQASVPESAVPVTGTASSTTIGDPGAVTIDNNGSMSVLFSGQTGSTSTISFPANWTHRANQNAANQFNLAVATRGPIIGAGSLDPGVITGSVAGTDRAVQHVEVKNDFFSAGNKSTLGVG